MFDEIADKFEAAWKKLRGQDKISDSNIQGAIREVRRALLEADVSRIGRQGFIRVQVV